jgi:hypothetical protein
MAMNSLNLMDLMNLNVVCFKIYALFLAGAAATAIACLGVCPAEVRAACVWDSVYACVMCMYVCVCVVSV